MIARLITHTADRSRALPIFRSTTLSRFTHGANGAMSWEREKRKKGMKEKLSLDILRQLPKAELHKHLDGSVRVETIIDLAQKQVRE